MNITWRDSWSEVVSILDDADRLALFDALLAYMAGKEPPTLTGAALGVWAMMKTELDAERDKHIAISAKRREAINTRWARRNTDKYNCIQMNTHEHFVPHKEKDTNKEKETAPPAPPYKEKEINKEKESTRIAETRARTREEGFYDELLDSPMWMQQAAAFFLLTEAELRQRLQAFQTECELKGTTHRDRQDYQRHFIDYTRIQLEKLQRNNGLDSFDAQELARRKRQASAAAYMANMLNNPEPDTLPF